MSGAKEARRRAAITARASAQTTRQSDLLAIRQLAKQLTEAHRDDRRRAYVSAPTPHYMCPKQRRVGRKALHCLCMKRNVVSQSAVRCVELMETALPLSLVDRASDDLLRVFARTNEVTQAELLSVYANYRQQFTSAFHPDGSRKPTNCISMDYIQDQFNRTSLESASLIFIPMLFVQESHGLPSRPRINNEIDFTRFIVAGYAFLRLSPAALILKLFRLLLDFPMTMTNAEIPLRPFEQLVGLLHGGINKPLLALLREAFGVDQRCARFGDVVRVCLNMPPIALPVLLFQKRLRSMLFGKAFWCRHAEPCLDPADYLFDDLAIHPSLEVALDAIESAEAAWRLCARRLCAWAASPSSQYRCFWSNAHLEKTNEAGPSRASANLLRDHMGYRLACFFETLANDDVSLAHSALRFALDGDTRLFLHIDPATTSVANLDWSNCHDEKTNRDYFCCPALGVSTWEDPRSDILYAASPGGRLSAL